MTFDKSVEYLNSNVHLIGSPYKENIVSDLIVVPTQKQALESIIRLYNSGEGYSHILDRYSDFDVIALLDISEYINNGYLMTESLDVILTHLEYL